ncbi:MAG: 1-(5-phosphoribosyl)-5-[(5-phosphoribosylamino)methylideneamino] imidazole-4-carboxamide isomerase [Bacteroidota bacterium]|nr:1-(5-phosphoribosyl)-5-[(5-phosphoribosylamino)methylideneamino] imidazole-4-carboxamide isomerase [Candidatus Kapabacteria bacterium]MDW8220165.1 1-(5-phosphoribosyl)-5-[(5-phosphoribosylamino)methylideneamino] imidazole-4-carboxamide isomerase [Bacteroidota bacterium]
MHIIPAIDIIEGKCVRLTQGHYTTKVIYDESPLDVALRLYDAGVQRVHIVDLDGARAKRIINYRVLEQITRHVESLHIDFGGGLHSDDDVRIALECGARQITIGSVAAHYPQRFLSWLARYGSETVILAADARNERIAVHSWEETTEIALMDFLAGYAERGVRYVLCTDIDRDGTMQGSSHALYRQICQQFPEIHLLASGGVASVRDLEQLEEIGVWGVVIGKALYEGAITLADLKPFL